jgi:hypothetical protein
MALGRYILQARQNGGFQMIGGFTMLTDELDDVSRERL